MEKRKRSKLTLEEVIEKWKRPYMSIIFLTMHFQKKEEGLQLLHYRYALVKKPNIIADCKERMEEFFGWKLKQLYYLNEIKKCITTTENLSKYLRKLVKWGAIKRSPDEHFKNLATYTINKKCFKKIDLIIRRTRISNKLKDCPKSLLIKLEENIDEELRMKILKKIEKSNYRKELKEDLIETIESLSFS